MILMEDERGLSLWPEELVASIVPAFPNRFRVVCADGSVGYTFRATPKVEAGYLREGKDPAGFPHEGVKPAPVPVYFREPYLRLRQTPEGLFWDEDVPCELDLEEACQGLVQGGNSCWFQPRRVRRPERKGESLVLVMDDGSSIGVGPKWAESVWEALGVLAFERMPAALARVWVRDFPFELCRAPAAVLREHFQDVAALLANLIWQQLSYHRLGISKGYGTTHRGFYYNPVLATVERLGLEADAAEALLYRILGRWVDEDQLFCYRDLGFEDAHAHLREIGARFPGVVLVIEKSEVAAAGKAAARHFGLSWIVTGGISKIVAAEFFAYALREVHQGDARALVFGDFDPGGRVTGRTAVAHLGRFGVGCPAGAEFLIDPSVFSEEELELFSRPLSAENDRVEEWLAETGGIHGQARGIHADWLQPPERLIPLVEARLASFSQLPGRPPHPLEPGAHGIL